jgi:hypothetical protein
MDGLGGRRSEKRRGYFGRIGLKGLRGREKDCPFRRVWRNPRAERSKLGIVFCAKVFVKLGTLIVSSAPHPIC